MPEQEVLTLAIRRCLRGMGRLLRPAHEIGIAHRVIAPVEHLTLPPEGKDSLGGAALIACVAVDRTPALRRPAHDLDGMVVRVEDELAVAGEALGRGEDKRCLDQPQARRDGGHGQVLEHSGVLHGGFLSRLTRQPDSTAPGSAM